MATAPGESCAGRFDGLVGFLATRLPKTFTRRPVSLPFVSRLKRIWVGRNVGADRVNNPVLQGRVVMVKASCHCGAVQIELLRKPRSLTRCTCSICHRYGALWAYCTRKTASIAFTPGAVSGYRWGDESLEFYHCTRCGCLTHYESVDKKGDGRIAVNARMISPAAVADVPVRTFDGADTWKYLDAQTR